MKTTQSQTPDTRLNRSLALLKQAYEQMVLIGPLQDMASLLRSGNSRGSVIENLLQTIHTHGELVDEFLQRLAGNDAPFVKIPPDYAEFYERIYLPNKEMIDSLYWDSILGDLDLGDLSNYSNSEVTQAISQGSGEVRDQPVLDTVYAALESQEWRAEDNPDWPEEVTCFEDARRIIDGGFFSPDEWLDNLKSLRPIVSNRLPQDYPAHVRVRVKEMFRSFVFGNWIAVYALARSVVEYTLLDRACSFKVEAYTTIRGKRRVKDLVDLIDAYKDAFPDLEASLDAVREYGNRAMHPSKSDKVVMFPHVMRDDALNCIAKTREVIRLLYAKPEKLA